MQDLRSFLELVKKENPEEVLYIGERISSKHEITAFVMALEEKNQYPIIIFKNVDGLEFPLIVNVHATRKRLALALNTNEKGLIYELRKREETLIKPKIVATGPVKEKVVIGKEIDLYKLPIPWHFESDIGPYICSGVVITKDPDSGIYNASFHRMQLKGKNKLAISLHSRRHTFEYFRRAEEAGKPLEVAIVLGYHPALALGAVAKGNINTDEYEVMGGILGCPLELTKASVNDLLIPAQAEMVIETEILPDKREPEGPFAEFPGYYSGSSTNNVMQVKAINYRQGAYYQDITPGRAKEHLRLVSVPRESSTFKLIQQCVPTVKDVCMPMSGSGAYTCYISLRKTAEGQGKNAIFAALAHDHFVKLAVVVDEDINVYNEEEVMWAVATRMQADKDVFIIKNVMGCMLDHTSNKGLTAKMGIDATRNLDNLTPMCQVSRKALNSVKEKIDRLNF